MSSTPRVSPYGFVTSFERVLAASVCLRPEVYARVGSVLEPVRLLDPVVQLAVQVALEIGKEGGQGPSAESTILQRLSRKMFEGKVTQAQSESVMELLLDTILPGSAEIIREAAPVLRRAAEGEAAKELINAYGKHADLAGATKKLASAQRIGVSTSSPGYKFGAASLDRVKALRRTSKLSTGIADLDIALDGGLPTRCMGMLVAADKAGKSMAMLSFGAAAMHLGFNVAYATLELSCEDIECRLLGNLCSLPYSLVGTGQVDDLVNERIAALEGRIGFFRSWWFPAKATTAEDLIRWVDEVEAAEGRRVDLLVVDYVDKLGSANKKYESSYDIQEDSTEVLRIFTHQTERWCWTASQAIRRTNSDPRKHYTLDETAGSKGKSRVVDLVLSMVAPQEDLREFKITGGRHGKQGTVIGPYPHAMNCGQIVATMADKGVRL